MAMAMHCNASHGTYTEVFSIGPFLDQHFYTSQNLGTNWIYTFWTKWSKTNFGQLNFERPVTDRPTHPKYYQ